MDQQDIDEFGALFKRFIEQSLERVGGSAPTLAARLRDHLGEDPVGLEVTKAAFPPYDHPNVHRALEARLAAGDRSFELVGVSGVRSSDDSLSDLVSAQYAFPTIGAVDYTHHPISVDDELACVATGLYLVVAGDRRFAALLRTPSQYAGREDIELELIGLPQAEAMGLIEELREHIERHNIFRGEVLSFDGNDFDAGLGPFRFFRREPIPADQVVLPDGRLERIERQVLGIGRRRAELTAAAQHLRRGILLYGPPGTGKTHTVRHLISAATDTTVVVLGGLSIKFLPHACGMARMLQPAIVVLEDCDLYAEARDFHDDEKPFLFQLLNEMDGLGDDNDVAFVLTTNRVEVLESALVQRPGRVDLAVEIPLPDADGRRRLFEIYGHGLDLDDELLDALIERTEGTTASFVKELVRRIVLRAAERGAPRPGPDDVRAALDEALDDQDELTRRLLGAGEPVEFGGD